MSDDHSQPSSESGRGHSSLRKTISLPPEALRKKSEASAKPITSEETIANLESKLEEMKKTKEMLEDERVSLLDTICKQDQQVFIVRSLVYVKYLLAMKITVFLCSIYVIWLEQCMYCMTVQFHATAQLSNIIP